MSLINDALKRTQQADQARPSAPPESDLPPADVSQSPASNGGGGAARRFLVVLVLVAVGLNLVLWLLFKNQDSAAKARARAATENAPVEPGKPAQTAAASIKTTAPATTSIPTNAATVVEPPGSTNVPPEPGLANRPLLRLQTVLAHPTRPSAMINGHVLFVGDRVAGYTIRKIGQNSVTLAKGDDVVVITLP